MHRNQSVDSASGAEQADLSNSLFFISAHHVGGRGGTRRFPTLPSFEHDLINVLYEADSAAIAEMKREASRLSSRQIILEACIGSGEGAVTFNQLWNSAASSFFPISEYFKKHYSYLTEDVLDYDDKAWSSMASSQAETISLDSLIERDKSVPPPDFLSLNTQGTELEILCGAPRLLNTNVIAIQTEISFSEIYKGQASLDDVTRHLRGSGFRITRIQQHGTRGHAFDLGANTTRTPIGLRGDGSVLQADALFFKEPLHIVEHHHDPSVAITKALYFGFVLRHFDYSYACAQALGGMKIDWWEPASKCFHYVQFVREYLDALSSYPTIFPPVWTQIFAPISGERLPPAAVRSAYFETVDKTKFVAAVKVLTTPNHFGVEQVATRYGLHDQAEALRHHRLSSIWNNLRYLGLVDDKAGGMVELHLERMN